MLVDLAQTVAKDNLFMEKKQCLITALTSRNTP